MFAQLPKTLLGSKAKVHKTAIALLKTSRRIIAVGLNNNEHPRGFHQITGDIICPGQVQGIDYLRDPRLNKGLAFTIEERQALGIHGLQPARFKSQEEQLELCRLSVTRYQEDLNKYLYMTELHDRNEKLFFRLLSENVELLMPIVYTPTVGLACQKFGLIYRRPRGLYVTINDKGHVFDVLRNWPEHDVKAICVTDGERILGLGDLGAYGMGIPVGKLALYTALAGIKPHHCLPITLDVGTNNDNLLEDPLYVGLRHKRVTGTEYDDFIDEFMNAVVKRYGQDTLIQFEDFGNHNAFRFLDKYRSSFCTFNDDIQGTASVVVAGLLASKRIVNKKLRDHKFMFLGAGEAAIGIANLTVKAMQKEGLSVQEARERIWMFDIDGLLAKGRPEGGLSGHKAPFVKNHEPSNDLKAIIEELKPTALIGASAAGGAFTPEIIRVMGNNNERPIIFALSNPTSKAECTAQAAYDNTDGRVIFSSGSPFGKVTHNGKDFYPGQGNNAYVFPGIALGVIATRIHHIRDELFLVASQTIADNVTDEDLSKGSLYPPLSLIQECSVQIACRIAQFAYEQGIATVYPEPENKRKYIEDQLYNFNYESAMPLTWKWPQPIEMKTRPLEVQDMVKHKN